jgi:hypothetical protein
MNMIHHQTATEDTVVVTVNWLQQYGRDWLRYPGRQRHRAQQPPGRRPRAGTGRGWRPMTTYLILWPLAILAYAAFIAWTINRLPRQEALNAWYAAGVAAGRAEAQQAQQEARQDVGHLSAVKATA